MKHVSGALVTGGIRQYGTSPWSGVEQGISVARRAFSIQTGGNPVDRLPNDRHLEVMDSVLASKPVRDQDWYDALTITGINDLWGREAETDELRARNGVLFLMESSHLYPNLLIRNHARTCLQLLYNHVPFGFDEESSISLAMAYHLFMLFKDHDYETIADAREMLLDVGLGKVDETLRLDGVIEDPKTDELGLKIATMKQQSVQAEVEMAMETYDRIHPGIDRHIQKYLLRALRRGDNVDAADRYLLNHLLMDELHVTVADAERIMTYLLNEEEPWKEKPLVSMCYRVCNVLVQREDKACNELGKLLFERLFERLEKNIKL